MRKVAENVEMSLSIPEEELEQAKVLVDLLKLLVRRLDNFNNYLDHLYNPFKDHKSVSEESVIKYRGTLWRYTEEIIKDFGDDKDTSKKLSSWSIKKIALVCASRLQRFSSDTQISKLLTTFTDDISNIESTVENMVKVIRNYETATYKDNVVKSMESVKREVVELSKIIEERIIDYVNTNILAKNWVEDFGEDFGIKTENKDPYIVRLYKERQKNQG